MINNIIKSKPTTPGRRFLIQVNRNNLFKGKPLKKLVVKKQNSSGRNNSGRITTRHKGGGHKQQYRIIDFKRNNYDIKGRVSRIEYDPNRSSFIALIIYKNGCKKYILAPHNIKVNDIIISSIKNINVSIGNCMPLKYIPLGCNIHNIEIKPGRGSQIIRSAGSYAKIIIKEKKYAHIKLQSGEIRKFLINCHAVIGIVSNINHNLQSKGKAGRSRWLGIRPTVRGVAMNPIDHPHGGGEGKTSGGRHPVSPTGKKTKGKKTRKKKYSDSLIIKKRKN
jgi:large subunit ribosomal protein L2